MSRPAPLVSIVTTLEYPRLQPLVCLESWTKGQTLPQDESELIVVASGRHGWLEREVSGILRPQDRMIQVKTKDEMALYDAGVREARGTWIMFTEPHCLAKPGCIVELIKYCEEHDLAGACVRTLPTPPDDRRISRMEGRMYEEAAALWTKEKDWRKFTKRGTLLKRSAYVEAGGLPPGHLRYGEITLAATLHELGHRVGHNPAAEITHYNPKNLAELLGYVWEFRRMERKVALSGSQKGKGTVTTSRAEADPSLSDTFAASPTLRRHVRDLASRKEMASIPHLPQVPGAGRLALRRALEAPRIAARFVMTWLRFTLVEKSEDASYALFIKCWQTFGDLSAALQGPLQGESHAPPRPLATGRTHVIGALDPSCLAGCHALEQHQEVDFRWTGPITLLRFAPQEEVPQEVILEYLKARPLKGRELRVWWNRTLLTFKKEQSDAGRWVFGPKDGQTRRRPVPGEADDLLVIFCPPVQGNDHDPRLLGLALKTVTVLP
ncbi:MAG TPA: glycosyltransferase, partial [Verrucomicrobium sp.]|nr:glycosyltransferase [Verrucomicrobium sp.]